MEKPSTDLGTTLAHDDGAGLRSLVPVDLHTEHLRLGIAPILGTARPLLVRSFNDDPGRAPGGDGSLSSGGEPGLAPEKGEGGAGGDREAREDGGERGDRHS
jgi:hypothetical protein